MADQIERTEKMVKALAVMVLSLGFVLCGVNSQAYASRPITFDGNIELRSPVFNSKDGYGWGGGRTVHPEMAGTLRLHNVLGNCPAVFWVNGEHTFEQAGVFKPENKLKIGVDYPVSPSGTLFVYFDRRFDTDVDRIFVGFRVGFKGKLSH